MTLNVSLRVPDGIVIASDSLATLTRPINQKLNVDAKCEKCGEHFQIKDVVTPPIAIPSSTWPYAQKLFPIERRFGTATYGNAFVNGRSIYNHVTEFAPKIPKAVENEDYFESVSKFVGDYFQQQLLSELKKASQPLELLPENWFPFGFHFVGFSTDSSGEPAAKTQLISIGKTVRPETHETIGCTVSGDTSVVRLLWPEAQPAANYEAFSLQDAIDYAKFLIRTTADYQRFSGMMPTVGGDIDIALVTNHRGFRWIQQKELYKLLERESDSISL